MAVRDAKKNIAIPESGLKIHGILREVPGAPLVVFSHCLTGSKNSLEYYAGARALSDAGFSTYRFDYYGSDDDQRKLIDCTIQIHGSDLDLVIETLRHEDPSRAVAVVGHSLGALTILVAKQRRYDAVVFWDGTHSGWWQSTNSNASGDFSDKWTTWEPALGLYRMEGGGYETLISKEYLASYRALDCEALARRVDVPVAIFVASEGVLQDTSKRYYETFNGPTELTVIDGADHCFTNDETLATLHRQTVSWLGGVLSLTDR